MQAVTEDRRMGSSGIMEGKRGVIMGVANERSIAWGIAQSLASHGAQLAFTYQGEAFRKRVTPLVEPLRPAAIIDCDVSSPASLDATFAELAEKMMPNGGSLLTLTYYGAEKVMPHYNVMGVAKAALEASVRYLAEDLGKKNIRVNALSAGPIRTLAASGVGDFRYILKWNELNSPLRRTVTISEVGDCALFLLSDLSRGVTGEILHVDSGYHIVGMKAEDAPDISAVKYDGA